MLSKIPCSVPILTLNCRASLEKLLPLLVETVEDVFIMDGNSTDGTQEYARSMGVRIEKQFDHDQPNARIENFSAMRERLWSKAKFDWLLLLDSDEEPTPAFLERVRKEVAFGDPKRAIRFYARAKLPDGRVVTQAFYYGNYYIRLFNRTAGLTLAAKEVHERFVVPPDVVEVDAEEMLVSPLPPSEVLAAKQKKYIALEVERAKGLSRANFLRWVVLYGLRSAFGQFLKSCVCWGRAAVRHETALPWAYVKVYAGYHLQLIKACFLARRNRSAV
jgi:glycosyltransferase involved in cell wall biosynthesis